MFECAKVGRICAGDSNKSAVDHIFVFIETDLREFADGDVQESLVFHAPIAALLALVCKSAPSQDIMRKSSIEIAPIQRTVLSVLMVQATPAKCQQSRMRSQ